MILYICTQRNAKAKRFFGFLENSKSVSMKEEKFVNVVRLYKKMKQSNVAFADE